jgi:hypothetical protein
MRRNVVEPKTCSTINRIVFFSSKLNPTNFNRKATGHQYMMSETTHYNTVSRWLLWYSTWLMMSSVADGFSTLTVNSHRQQTIPSVSIFPVDHNKPAVVKDRLCRSAKPITTTTTIVSMSSFSADGSDYTSKDSDYDTEEFDMDGFRNNNMDTGIMEDDIPTEELKPVPLSKNAGNRFVALYWDHELQKGDPTDQRDPWELHSDRDDLNEDHVMFCRKRNLYNETFNTDSMVDIMRSFPM